MDPLHEQPQTIAKEGRGLPLREYYLGLGSSSVESSIETLSELIVALKDDDGATAVSVVVCVSSRDTLDDVVCGLHAIKTAKHHVRINLWSLHSDLLEREVTSYANEFREVARSKTMMGDWSLEEGDAGGATNRAPLSVVNVMVTTDSPLKTLSKLHSDPLSPTLMIHYTLPRRREDYTRRKSVVLGSRKSSSHGRVAVCFVHAGQLEELHEFEAMADRTLLEMPVHVKDIFAFRS
jgi:hypothetical protein